jgi:hypothetical protein
MQSKIDSSEKAVVARRDEGKVFFAFNTFLYF